MRQNSYGLPTFQNVRLGPTPREEGAALVRARIEAGEIIPILIPWQKAKDLKMLPTLHPKGQDRELRLRPGVVDLLVAEKRRASTPI